MLWHDYNLTRDIRGSNFLHNLWIRLEINKLGLKVRSD